MGRKKKNKLKGKGGEDIEGENDSEFTLNISGEAKRSIVAVFLFALALILILGFIGKAGMAGDYLNKMVGIILGWGKWLLPVVLVMAGIILLYRKETLFYVTKLIGLLIAFMSILGFLHIYFDSSQLLEVAKEGVGGGYIGYVVSYVLMSLVGKIAGTIILVALFLIGIIVAFNFSVASFFKNISSAISKKEEEGEDVEIEKLEGLVELESQEEVEKEEGEKQSGEEGNIKNIKFVEDAEGDDDSDDEKLKIKEMANDFLKKGKGSEDFLVHPLNRKWEFPPINLLEVSSETAKGGDVEKNANIIQKTLGHFGINVELGEIKTGPTVTQYSFRPAEGVKLSRITALSNDLALALAAHPIRIEAPIPGKSLIGIEVPNKVSAIVRLRDMLQSNGYKERKSNLSIALGKDVSGISLFGNLEKMPHLMIAGATGTGKSVCINTLLLSLFYQNSPEDLKLILVDPKRVELSLYNGIPYLLSDVIVENGKVVSALKWAIGEMEKRYRLLQDVRARDIGSFNQKVREGKKRKYEDPETGEERIEKIEKLPFIVIVIDELADLMSSHGKEVEGAIIRLAQMSRAVGIHLIVSTQRPSVEVLTGLIKANITTRIAFQVATQIDSRTILDASGAEKLLGDGDLLFVSANSSRPKRLQGALVGEEEVKKVVRFIKNQKIERGDEEIGEDITNSFSSGSINSNLSVNSDQEDSLYKEAESLVIETGKASASLLQRRLRVGYARAARLIDILEQNNVVGPADGAKPREILLPEAPSGSKIEDAIEEQENRDKWQV